MAPSWNAISDMAKSAVMTLALCSVLTACNGSNGTPAPSSGPAFAVAAPLHQEHCGDHVCVRQQVKNYGDQAGGGECVLNGYRLNTASPGASVDGPTVVIPTVAPGETTTLTARWSGPIPDGGLRFLCEPHVRL
jgi:hypothetical protein